MEIKKLTILGKSDPTITMILDNLESNNQFPIIEIINNFNLPIEYELSNSKFQIVIKSEIDTYEHCFLGVNKSINKSLVYNKFGIQFSEFINVIHKSSQISTTTKLGKGCLINSLVSVAAHSKLGNFVSLNRNSSIGHHTTLEDFVTIQPGANVAGFVTIGENTLVGMGANIFDGVKIGKNSIIGAGSVVTKDIPDNVVAYGNPCKIIRTNETQSV
jgi:sugar O-acyltransferase (sialic acid O-acetyltransferase NeuD family)